MTGRTGDEAPDGAPGGVPERTTGDAQHVVELEIPPRNAYLAVARRFVAAAAAANRVELGAARLNNLQLAVSEACTNAINAQAARGIDDAIAIRCTLRGEAIEVTISDRAGGFDPDAEVGLPAPDDPRRLDFEHGLGLQLMKVLTDQLEIRSSELGTNVHVVMWSGRAAC